MANEISLIYPVGKGWIVTQNYSEHIRRAIENGWFWKPGPCQGGSYYYGGIDWGCPMNTPVYAAASGIVPKLANNPGAGYGLGVYILHPAGLTTIYGHLSQIRVKVGDKIKQGQLIGYSGSTGYSTGPHIHFELRDPTGLAIDPQPFLDSVPVIPPPPPPEPPIPSIIEGTTIRVRSLIRPRLRSAPLINPANILVERLQPETRFIASGLVSGSGITWVKVYCYIAAEYVEVIK